MSDASIQRIMAGLDAINGRINDFGERVASLETTVKALDKKVDEYNGLKDRTFALEASKAACDVTLQGIKDNCATVQKNKASTRIPWQNIVPQVIVGIILIIAGAILALVLKG